MYGLQADLMIYSPEKNVKLGMPENTVTDIASFTAFTSLQQFLDILA